MKMAMKDGKIMLIEVDNTQMAIIKSWNSMKYDRRKNMMIGDCSKELLDKLSKIVRLPPAIESYRQRLDETQRAVDKMRVEKEPEATKLAAQADRIMHDLYEEVSSYTTPVEDYLEGQFEDAEADPEAEAEEEQEDAE